jgi:opacity protein-like surface antigen
MRTILSTVPLMAALAAAPAVALADDETEYHFGFTTGTSVGDIGEKEIQSRLTGRFGKGAGHYSMLSNKLEAEYVPLRDFRLSLAAYVTQHRIAGIPGLDDRRSGAFDGLAFGLKYRLIDRDHGPFGLAVEAEPQWRRMDGTSGAPVDQMGGQYSLLLDKELVPNRIISAFNLVYEPEVSRSRITGAWSHESTVRAATAIMAQARPDLFLGMEARYLRKYEGLALDRFAGHALYLGPTVSAKLPGGYWLLVAWNIQVAGRSVGGQGPLDLTNFERHQVRLKLGFNY